MKDLALVTKLQSRCDHVQAPTTRFLRSPAWISLCGLVYLDRQTDKKKKKTETEKAKNRKQTEK